MPGSLQRRFVYQKTLSGGGEANLFLATDNESNGLLVVVKLYNQGIGLNEEAMTRLKAIADRNAENASVVRLITWGIAPDAQQSYEVQEYLDAGDLYQFLSRNGQLRDGRRRIDPASELAVLVVEELYLALKAMHDAGLSHQDIKPSNVLVRAVSPRLDLVLADFGLAVAADRTVFLSRRMGTIAYDSPESLGAGQGGPKRDFWALGMTIAEVVSGRHPFATVDNPDVFLSDAAIRDHLYSWRPIDLSAVDDDRFRLLCEGLTRYHEDHRWGAHEIEAWLAGRSPDVLPDEHRSEGVEPSTSGITFAGRVIGSRAELAEAMAGDWRAAAGQLSSDQSRQAFLDQIASTLGSAGIEELETNWAAESPGIDRSIADLICTLDPTRTQAVFRGFLVGADDLAPLARSVAGDDQRAAAVIEPLFNQHGLIPLSSLPGHSQLREIDDQWHEAMPRYEAMLQEAGRHGVACPYPEEQALAQLLAALADPVFNTELGIQARRAAEQHPECRDFPWMAKVTHDSDAAAHLATFVLAQPAAAAARETRERTRRQKEERRQAAEREQQRTRLTAQCDALRQRSHRLPDTYISAGGFFGGSIFLFLFLWIVAVPILVATHVYRPANESGYFWPAFLGGPVLMAAFAIIKAVAVRRSDYFHCQMTSLDRQMEELDSNRSPGTSDVSGE
ncbi:MAG: serine/threonine protein kinase [Acidimicrobiales bacterium]